MRPLAAIVLTSLLFVSLFGFQISFIAQRAVVHRQMAQKIKAEKKKAATQFVFSTSAYSSLRKFEGEKEFSWQGNMYDVVDKYTDGNNVIITAYLDHKETSILAKFVAMFEEDDCTSNTSHHYQKRINLPEFVWQESLLLSTPSVMFVSLHQSTHKPVSYITETQSPPPDFIVV